MGVGQSVCDSWVYCYCYVLCYIFTNFHASISSEWRLKAHIGFGISNLRSSGKQALLYLISACSDIRRRKAFSFDNREPIRIECFVYIATSNVITDERNNSKCATYRLSRFSVRSRFSVHRGVRCFERFLNNASRSCSRTVRVLLRAYSPVLIGRHVWIEMM